MAEDCKGKYDILRFAFFNYPKIPPNRRVVGSYLDSLPKSKKKNDSSFLPFKKAPDCSSLNGQRNKKTSRGGTEKSGVYSINPVETLTQAIGNLPGSKLDEVMKYPRSYQQRQKKQVSNRSERRGRVMSDFERFAREILPGIILLLMLFINLFGSVQAQADCLVLNDWIPDHANSNGCCDQTGITCAGDRITKMYVVHH
jgi:hypothetical protein